QVEANANPATAVPVRRCQTVSTYENRVVGYDVVYEYAGQRYSTRMARDPGRQIAISVQPVDAGAAGQPVPTYTDPMTQAEPPQTVYYAPAPRTVYYAPAPPAVYMAPSIGIGFGFGYGGGYGGYSGGYGGYSGYRGGYWGHGGDRGHRDRDRD
ncbi:MAG TPA: hypothetical protein VIM34_04960, partial [Burkholderiaceae bacterium]